MVTLCQKLQPYISLDRVKEIGLVRELIECSLCHGLLWHPVDCENCEKTFCSSCIQAWHASKSERICPHGCSTYSERRNPPIPLRLLGDLKISCRYQSNGCTEILSYNELEKHEQRCDYQLLTCSGCEQEIIRRNFDEHQRQCRLLLIKCDECLTSYKREDENSHKLTECSRIQLNQHKSRIQQLEMEVANQQTKIEENDILWKTFSTTINDCK
jgi:hypothetical protein